ncbi:secreted protein [Melampsora americana]|nr:secreted protein [Melampsora americana]
MMFTSFIFFPIFGLLTCVNAHLSLISIHGSNNKVGHAFGVHTDGKYPRRPGGRGDAGGDSGVFQTGTDHPNPACGSTPELGQVDVTSWLSQAEGSGLPAAYPNGSIVVTAFQVNRDGGGPMICEYNEDATTKSFKPMTMTLNQAGNHGILPLARVNTTVVMTFPPGAKCTGGWTQTACIVRCRTGVNKRFGGCFAAKLASSNTLSLAAGAGGKGSNGLTSQQINQIAAAVLAQMKSSGYVISKSAKRTRHRHRAVDKDTE